MSSTVPPAVAVCVVRWARRADLLALCLASAAFRREAEPRLYEVVVSASVRATLRACHAILAQPRLGPLVRTFCFLPDARRARRDVPAHFWPTLQHALARMRALDFLFLHDPALASSWVLSDAPRIPFQLREAKLLFCWDAHLVRFLESQNSLRSLCTVDGPADDPALHLEPGSLPALCILDAPLSAARHILTVGAALTHLQLILDKNTERDLLAFIPRLAPIASSLRAFSVLHLPDSLALGVLRSLAVACPQLRHLGTLPLPLPQDSHHVHTVLMAMRHLRVLELDLSAWAPPPTGVAQRVLAADLRIYAPSIEHVCFWTGPTRTLWSLDGNDWSCHAESGQHAQLDALWKTT